MARDRAHDRRDSGRGRVDEVRALRDRTCIAQGAARLIAEHGITDWSLAKRKAARALLLPDSTAMPSNDEIEQALADHHALFGGAAHAASLRRQRAEAILWMRRLAPWEPLLVGGVAAGWATEHSDVRLEVVADDPKAVEIALVGDGIAYAASPPRDEADRQAGLAQLYIATPRAGVLLSIVSPQQRRSRPRRDDELRLAVDAVLALQDEAGK